jgi:hypothetical protein
MMARGLTTYARIFISTYASEPEHFLQVYLVMNSDLAVSNSLWKILRHPPVQEASTECVGVPMDTNAARLKISWLTQVQ